MRCPKCSAKVPVWPRHVRTWWRGRKVCPSCGVTIECENTVAVGIVGGGVCGLIVANSRSLGFENPWLSFVLGTAIAFAACWWIWEKMPKWRVVEPRPDPPRQVSRWDTFAKVCQWVCVSVCGLLTVLWFYLVWWVHKAKGSEHVPGVATDFTRAVQIYLIVARIGGAVLVAALVGWACASFMKCRASRRTAGDAPTESPPPT